MIPTGGPFILCITELLDIARTLLTIALAGESFFGTALFSWLQVERMALDFLNDIFLLNLALKTPEGAFERLAILQMDFCQTLNSPAFRYARPERANSYYTVGD